ncbi:DUF732 domain-containing protein [Skermania sp. ID1734]|uniref:DUF732 domain-containing protein n=1 Tax=Skermania sp. ID1734 TaxID=2597516 RepID=UPI001C8F2B86|nr:DUF732 domain-containing protein [Skermania sp. ID1734]
MTPEADFLHALPDAGIPVRDKESVFGTGQRICEALASGKSTDEAAALGVSEQQWSQDQARKAVSIAAQTMCRDGGN